jgi:hypothetical protein
MAVLSHPGTVSYQRGDSLAVRVTFSGTGGTVTPEGLFTAGVSTGEYRVIAMAKAAGLAETTKVTVTGPPLAALTGTPPPGSRPGTPPSSPTGPVPIPRGNGVGIPFGAFGGWDGFAYKANTDDFVLSIGGIEPEDLVQRIASARASKRQFLLTMTGGAHRNYKTDGAFDLDKWKARMDRYNTPAVKAAVAAGVVDGTIVGNSVMDEPQNTSPENSWGPVGTMSKARVDEMCGYVKAMFPTLPVGVVHDHRVFEPDTPYHTCDFIVSQYRWGKTKGDVAKFRDDALAVGKRDGIAIAFSLNILDGGIPRERKGEPCPIPETGGDGTSGKACRMTADQVREWGLALGPAGCALTMWRYDPGFMADPKNIQAFKDVAAALAKAPASSCRRR